MAGLVEQNQWQPYAGSPGSAATAPRGSHQADSAVPAAYMNWLETIRKFYTTLNEDAALLQKLARFKVTAEDVTAGLAQITVVEKARAEFLRESGESQAATDTKDTAFAQLDEWMGEFYAVARIALEDKPQLLEVLGKTIKR